MSYSALANPSTVYDPTPPIPYTATLAFFNFSTPAFPINNSVLKIDFSYFYYSYL